MPRWFQVPGWGFVCAAGIAVTAIAVPLPRVAAQQPRRGLVTIRPSSVAELRDWAPRIDSLRRVGDLRLRLRRDDLLVTGRTHERYDQFHRGVRIVGADVAEQLNGGQMISAFGTIYEGVDVDTNPAIDADRARETVEERAGVEIGRTPELVILPRGEAGDVSYLLAWRVRAVSGSDVREYSSMPGTAASPSTTAISKRRAPSAAGR